MTDSALPVDPGATGSRPAPPAPARSGQPPLRVLGAYALAALALLLLYTGVARWYTGGVWSLPLDDPFIYLQYARQTAQGHLFQYNTGDPPTTGCTSPLYVLLLVPGFWLGLDGLAMIPYLLLVGVAALAGTVYLTHRIAARWLGQGWGAWAGGLVLLCGPVGWGAFSGMEIPVFTLALVWLLDRADRVMDGGARPAALVLPASVTALARPEGWIAVAALGALLVIARHRAAGEARAAASGAAPAPHPADLPFDLPAGAAGGGHGEPRGGWPGWLVALALPLVVGLLPGILFRLAGASFTPAGVTAKSLLASQPLEIPEVVRQVLVTAIEILKGIFAGSLGHTTSFRLHAYDMNARAVFFAPLTFLLFMVGLAPAVAGEWRRRRPARASLVAAWFLLLLLATATLIEADAHFNRYQMPIMPLFLLGTVVGAVRLGRWAERAVGGAAAAALAPGLLGSLLLFGVASTGVFAVHYGDNASDIQRLQGAMARWIDERLPADAVVAINDAGVLRYLSTRRTLDLVGLTSPGMARIWREGSGSLIEHFEGLPAPRRPSHFAIFPNWFRLGETGLLHRLESVRLQTPSIVDAEKILYAADWSALRADPGPCLAAVVPAGHRIVDQVDVADLDDEAEHGLRSWQGERGVDPRTVAVRARCAADSAVAFTDGGRVLLGGVAMRVAVEPGREAVVVSRTRGGLRQQLSVRWNGAPVAEPGFRGPDGEWVERVIATVPAALVTGRVAELSIEVGGAGSPRPLLLFHVWITQPE